MGDETEERRKRPNAAEADRRKTAVGMAKPGTSEYYRRAAYVLRAYKRPNATTRAKLSWLEKQGY